MNRATALRYALAPICVGVAAMLQVSPLGPHPIAFFVLGVVTVAWFGGAGPGLFAALLAALLLPFTIDSGYPLLLGFLDLPRFITLGLVGAAVGWGKTSRRGAEAALRERKQAEMALRESESRYERAMTASQAGHWDWDVLADKFYVSPKALELAGFPPATTFAGRADYMARAPIHPEDRARWERAVKELFSGTGERLTMEVRYLVGGETRWYSHSAICTRDATGKVVRWSGSATDVTERKRAEQELRESEARYERVVLSSNAGIWDWDVVRDEYYLSPRLLEITGFPPGTTFSNREEFMRGAGFHPQDLEDYQQAVKRLFAGSDSRLTMDLRMTIKGEMRWYQLSGICFRDAKGSVVRWTGAATEITDRKRAEEALRESQERYALAVAGSDDGVWDVDFAAHSVFVSARARELVGMPAGPEIVPLDEWFANLPLHPDDVPLRAAAMQAHLEGRTPAYVGEFRLLQPDGVYRWRRLHGLCLRDADGKPHRMAGSISDIDAQKRAEDALRLSEERYALALEASEEGHFDTDLETGQMFVSARLNEIYGFPRQAQTVERVEYLNRLPFHPDDRHLLATIVRSDWEASAPADLWPIAQGDLYEFECRIVPGPGEMRWIHTRGKVIRDAEGRARRRIGVVADITQRKLAEDARRLSEERYALAMEAAQDAHWDWIVGTDEYYTSPRVVDVFGLPPGTAFTSRQDYLAKTPLLKEDLDVWLRKTRELFAGTGLRLSMDLRAMVHGEIHWIQHNGVCFRDASGRAVRWCGSVRDVTERRRAEEALRLSEKRYALAMEVADEGHFDWNVQTDEIFSSARALSVVGVPPDAKCCTRADVMAHVRYHPDDEERIRAEWRAALEGRAVDHEFEYRILRGEEPRSIRGRWKVFRDEAGVALRVIGVVADITERKRAEEARRLSEERYALAMQASGEGHWDWKIATDEFYASPRYLELAGFPPDMKYARRDDVVPFIPFHPDDRKSYEAAVAAHFAGQTPRVDLVIRLLPRGELRWLHVIGSCTRDAGGRPVRWAGSVSDITSRKLAEDALRRSQASLLEGQRLAQMGNFSWRVREGEITWSEQIYRIFEFEPASRVTLEGIASRVPPEDMPMMLDMVERAQRGVGDFEYEHRVLMPDGRIKNVHLIAHRTLEEDRLEYIGAVLDITARKRAEEALRQSEERYALAVEGSNEGIFDWDLVSDRVYVSYRAQELFGLPRGELWRPRRDWRHILSFHPDDAPRLHDSIKAHIEGGAPTYDVEFRIVLPGGGVRWFRQRGVALRDASGKAYRVVGSIGDVTERHKAEEELSSLERQLRLAQRLEAMGTLAGGIAHDFNNILGAILGYGEMALRDAPKGSRLARDLDSIVVAGERGRALVDRVLSFSRSAVGERVPVHVEKVVREALDLIAPKLPPNVTLHAKLHAGRAALLGDATQVHQVLMNLATNAIQAMPSGGTLRVSLSAARLDAPRTPTLGSMPAGDYLILEVADNGTGIAPEILDRVFDPFFTTKDVGTGTGLGLSLVHGIVAELGGAIDVASTPGAGSTFTVYLPRSGDALDSSQEEEPELPRGDGQRVLVVDDEEPLVRLATRTLEELGYVATGFTSSAAALSAFRADPQRFDALITDERMPGMSGSRLIREVRGIRSRIPVVLMSGFVGAAVTSRAREAGAEEVLKKPLSARDLAASLARVLHP